MLRLLSAMLVVLPVVALASHAPVRVPSPETMPRARASVGHAAAELPTNLCASCHGAGQRQFTAQRQPSRLGEGDMAAVAVYMRLPRRG